jgi:hypothetical protein
MAKRKKDERDDVTFIVTRSGRDKPRAHFFRGEKSISPSDLNVRYRNSQSGRFIERSYIRGRDAETGQFTTVGEARRHPKNHVVERVPKPGFGDIKEDKLEPVPRSSPIYFREFRRKRDR